MSAAQRLIKEAPEGTFFSRTSREFYGYWYELALRRGGVPLREDLNPADIVALLPYVFIIEKEAGSGRFQFRLSGTGIREILGRESTHCYVDEMLEGEDLATVTEILEQVLAKRVCVRTIEGLTYSDSSYRRVEVVRLPLRGNADLCNLILGCLSRIDDDDGFGHLPDAVNDRQVMQVDYDVLPRRSF